ncbi:MAG: His/Gly/Thr/Pro-type tRNA ligase C-terminal domain-containing protein, partial [Acidimicrobiia bacterium]
TEWGELEGIANRTDFDLKAHEKVSGEELTYFDQEKEERFHPYVIEPAAGVDRATLAFLCDAYTVEEAPNAKGEMEKRTVLKLHNDLAPIKIAILPLSRNEKLVPKAREVFDLLKGRWMCDYDDAGSIGRRYRRQDEVGTPFCVTVDFDSLDDNAVTIRDRDTMAQDRLPIEKLVGRLQDAL